MLAVRRGVIDYDHRHGYRGPEAYVRLPDDAAERETDAGAACSPDTSDGDGLVAGVVTEASPTLVKAVLADGEVAEITGDGLKFVARSLGRQGCGGDEDPVRRDRPPRARRQGRSGDYPAAAGGIRLRLGAGTGRRDPLLVGGWSFERNKFNHVTQAQRQPGSAFKPFIYSAALEKGFTPATIVNDAPFFVPAASGRRGLGAQELRREVLTARCASAPRWRSRRTSSRFA